MTSFTMTLAVPQPPEEVFTAVSNARRWWSEDIEGDTTTDFTYHYQDLHRCRIKVTELAPTTISWQVLENHFAFTEDQTEWTNTTITFDIAETSTGTILTFTHHGLIPTHECYTVCDNAWRFYIGTSLHNLITTGEGTPNTGQTNHVPPLAGTR
ncbi:MULTISPECIES: SRPBCC family protein [unclassified Saccharothrix]|uniref:SRPBCC family protein n=1 Tax=unclassified Saccharothrix TaxID=2593673 RepID=UPI00307F7AF4